MFRRTRHFLHAISVSALLALAGCGGGQTAANCPKSDPPGAPAPAAQEPASDPPPFEGTFELVRGTDGKTTVDFPQVIHEHAIDGQILWTIEKGSFSLAVWVLGNYRDPDHPERELLSLCRGRATVSARYEGKTLVLPGTLAVKGFSTAVYVERTRDAAAGKTTTRTRTKNNDCAANVDTGRLTLEVIERDGDGPMRLRATVEGGTFELRRAAPVDKLDEKAIVQAATTR